MKPKRNQRINLFWVAIDRYRDRHWSALQNSVSSSETLEDTLKEHYSLADSEITCLPNKQATLPEIERTLRSYLPGGLRELTEDDQLIISFSGHGERDKLTSETAFIPYDGDPESPTSWFRFNTLKPILKNIAAHHILVLSDSCFSGGVFRSQSVSESADLINAEFARRASAKRSRMMLSSGGDELVQDFGGSVGHSVFMDGLVHALKTPVEPWLLAEKLFLDTRNYVVLNAHQTPEFGYLHDAGHAGGQLLLSKALAESKAPLDTQQIEVQENKPETDVGKRGSNSEDKPADVQQAQTVSEDDISSNGIGQATIQEPLTEPFGSPDQDQDQDRLLSESAAHLPVQTDGRKTKSALIAGGIAVSLIAGLLVFESSRAVPQIVSTPDNGAQDPVITSSSSSSLIAACDQEAGSKHFTEIAAEQVVAFDDIQAANAISACEDALEQNPTNTRSMHQLGRAYDKMARETGQQEWAIKANEQYEIACAAGSGESCNNLGAAFDDDASIDLIEQDFRRANQYFLRGCELESGTSCDNLGLNYEFSNGFDQNYREAAAAYQLACELGSAAGCDHLGDMYEYGKGINQDRALAADSYRQACEGGFGSGCGHFADLHDEKSVGSPDYKIAAEYFLRGCELQNAWSCRRYGVLYRDARLGEANFQIAADYFLKGCDLGNGQSCARNAEVYANGWLGETDMQTAASFWLRGCEGNHGSSCNEYGFLHESSELGAPNTERAREFYEKGCGLENGKSCAGLGWLVLERRILGSPESAAEYFIKSLSFGGQGPFGAFYPEEPRRYVISEARHQTAVRNLQDKLRDENVFFGSSDGIIGNQTLTAARSLCNCSLPLDS